MTQRYRRITRNGDYDYDDNYDSYCSSAAYSVPNTGFFR
jgi:hypothetical protein